MYAFSPGKDPVESIVNFHLESSGSTVCCNIELLFTSVLSFTFFRQLHRLHFDAKNDNINQEKEDTYIQ